MTRTDSVGVKRWRAKYALIERAAEADKHAQALFTELDTERLRLRQWRPSDLAPFGR